jgi:uncharacterized spore protein YtfJ
MMSLNRLFETIEQARDTANWRTAFGEPQVVEDKTIIPVARVRYGFGFGFGSGTGEAAEGGESPPEGEGGGGGGAAAAKPLGVLVVTPESVHFEETMDVAKVSIAGMILGGFFILQLTKTLRVLFGRE